MPRSIAISENLTPDSSRSFVHFMQWIQTDINVMSSCSLSLRVGHFLQKLVATLVTKSRAFVEQIRFFTIFSWSRRSTLFWASWFQFTLKEFLGPLWHIIVIVCCCRPPPRSQNLAVKISLVSSADCFFSMCSQLSFTPWLLTWHNVKYINVCKLLSYWRQSVTHVSITLACAGCSSEFESKIFDHKPPKCVMS